MTDETEYSPYITLVLTKSGSAFIDIYKQKGAFAWTLEIDRDWKNQDKIITWPNPFLSDKAALDAAKKELMDMGLLSDDWEKLAISKMEVEDFMRKKGKLLNVKAES